jgi:hypothetical protein
MNPIPIPVPKGGVRPDLDPLEIGFGALAYGQNVYYQDGFFQVRPGPYAYFNDIDQRPSGYAQYLHNDGSLRTVKATTAGWWKGNSGTRTWTDISGTALTGSPDNQQIFRVFQKAGATHLLGVNDKDSPKKWDGLAPTYLAMGGTPPIARCMMVLFNYVLLGNLSSGGTVSAVAVDVSAEGNFDSGWGSTLVKLLNDTPGSIAGMLEFSNFTGAIYKDDAIVNVYPQPSTEPFRFEFAKLQAAQAGINFGPVSAAAVFALDSGGHVLLGKDYAARIWDGAALMSLPYAIQKQIADTCNPALMTRAWGFYDGQRRKIWYVYPESGATDPNLAVCIDRDSYAMYPFRWDTLRFAAGARMYDETGLTIGELVGTIGGQTQTLGAYATRTPRNFFGEIGGQTFIDIATTDNGAAISAYAETGLEGDARRKVTVKNIKHRFKKAIASQSVTVKLGKSNDGEDRVLDSGSSIDIGNAGPYYTGHRKTGNYFSMRIECNATLPVAWRGSDADVAPRGER